jgi:TolB-like protein
MKFRNFLAELRRRNVYKVAVAYAVVAWLLIQAASILFPTFGAPGWVMKVFVTIVAAGFPIALIIAWAFEMTPEGIKRTENVPPDEFIPQWSRRKFALLIISVALAAGALLGLQIWRSTKAASDSDKKSIAVLPFESLSEDTKNAYFADGIQDEILTRLSKIADLKVISRTSTERYKSAPNNLREIAQQLGVANILEGSVQKANDQVRVTVQLISALNDSHLWADTYDRKLTDIFSVESEIAQKIAGSLEVKLTGREKHDIAIVGTKNPEAYDAVLHALALQNNSDESDIDRQIEYLQRAVQLDSGYADAWADLALAQLNKFASPWQSPELAEEARKSLESALRLAPDSANSHKAMGLYDRYCRNDDGAALAELQIAHERAPNDGSILDSIGLLQRAQGKPQEALATFSKASTLDPLNLNTWYRLAEMHRGFRQFDEQRAALDRGLAIAPQNLDFISGKAESYQAQGDLESAWKMIASHPFPSPSEWGVVVYTQQYYCWRAYNTLIAYYSAFEPWAHTQPPLIATAIDAELANFYLITGSHEMAQSLTQRTLREIHDLRAHNLFQIEISDCTIEFFARLGDRAEMEKEIAFAFERTSKNQWLFQMAQLDAARGYAIFGDIQKALPLLQDTLSKPGTVTVGLLKLDPAWDPIRNDSRFQKLLHSDTRSD